MNFIIRAKVNKSAIVRSEKAWKPKRDDKLGETVHEIELNLRTRKIRSILNKITSQNFDKMSKNLWLYTSYMYTEDNPLLIHFVDILFEKAVGEPLYCELYAMLCLTFVKEENFRNKIIEKCRKAFMNIQNKDIQETADKLKNAELTYTKKLESEEQLKTLKSQEKRRNLGIVRFIGELFRHHLIRETIISYCVVELLKLFQDFGEEDLIEYAILLIQTVGPVFCRMKKAALPARAQTATEVEKTKEAKNNLTKNSAPLLPPPANDEMDVLDKYFNHIRLIKVHVSTRMKVLIMNMEELKRNDWVSKPKVPPTTATQRIVKSTHSRDSIKKRIIRKKN